MTIRYSYDDFTTKGHGVIEGEFYHSSKSKKRKNVAKNPKKTKIDQKSIYKNLMAHHKKADEKRRIEEAEKKYGPITPRKVPPQKQTK